MRMPRLASHAGNHLTCYNGLKSTLAEAGRRHSVRAHLGGLPGQGDLLRAVTCCAAEGMAMATSRSGVLLWVDSSSSRCP